MRSARGPFLLALACVILALLPAAAVAAPPTVLDPPTIYAPFPATEQPINASAAMWGAEATSITRGWLTCTEPEIGSCTAIPSSDSLQYTPEMSDKGRYLALSETAVNENDDPSTANTATSNFVGPVLWAEGIIDNGAIGLGVRPTGSINVDGGPTSSGGVGVFGLRLLGGMYDAISPGSPAEGWGLADVSTGIRGFSNRDQGDTNVELESFSFDGESATSVTVLNDDSDIPYARVTHEFAPSAVSYFLYEIKVTIEPLSLAGMSQAVYRRNVDWDIEPTPFNEVVTTVIGNATNLKGVSDDGFTSSNPLESLSSVNTEGETFSNGPGDIGAAFDFDFGTIPIGSTKEFTAYYGAAPTRQELLDALEAADIETFSIAHNSNEQGFADGSPAVFALGFSGVGGSPLIDSGAPTATITDAPVARETASSATFEFESDYAGSTFECRLNDAAWAACTSPTTYNGLEDENNYRFLVRASNDGRTQLLPTSHAWRVTQRPFSLYFDVAPGWWTSSTTAQFATDADDADIDDLTLTCALDDAAMQPCSTSEMLIDLEQGQHTFRVSATDGNRTEELTYAWTISDGVMTRLTYTPNHISTSHEPTFEWQRAGDVDGVDCKVDDEAWEPCDEIDEHEVSVGNGEHTFSVRAYDSLGNYQSPITSYTWTVDGRRAVITSNLPDVVSSVPLNVEFYADKELDYLTCQLDGDPRENCLNGRTISTLTPGWHEIYVEAETAAGSNVERYFEFYYDPGASVATITSKPARWTTDRSARFEFSAEPGSTFECQINGGDWEPCSSPATYDLLAFEDSNEFQVRASKGGRTQEEATRYSWRITDKPFQLYFDDAPSLLTTNLTAGFDIDADRINRRELDFSCSLDGGAFKSCGRNFTFKHLAPGAHTVTVRGGREGVTEEITHDWFIYEAGEPAVKIHQGPDEHSNETATEFSWDRTPAVDSVECRLDNGSWAACLETEYHVITGLSEGQHVLELRPRDASDNAGPIETYSWSVDTTPPVIDTSAIPPTFSLPYQLPITSNEPLKHFYCVLDGDERGDCGFPLKLNYLTLGEHEIQYVAVDLAGNAAAPTGFTFRVVAPPTPDPVDPTPVTPNPVDPKPAVKPGLKFTKPKARAKQLKMRVDCPVARCTVSGFVKVGKKKYKLSSKSVKQGSSSVKIKFNKKLSAATKKARKGKTSYSVTVSGGGAKTTRSGKF